MATTWTGREQAANGNRRTLMISLAFGLVSAFLIYRLLAGSTGKGSTAGTVPVLVAKQDIPARTVVTDAMVGIRQITPGMRVTTALTDSKGAVGHVTRDPVSAGEQILTTRLADTIRDVGFSGQIPQGMRGVSISAAEVQTDGGLVQPGDYVDVIGVFARTDQGQDNGAFLNKDPKAERVTAVTVLQDVQVLAVGQSATDPLAQQGAKNSKAQPDAKSLTLAVTPQDAQKLFLVDQTGQLRLSLHHFGDHDNQPLPSVDNDLPGIYGIPGSSGLTPSSAPAAPAGGPAAPQTIPQPGSATR